MAGAHEGGGGFLGLADGGAQCAARLFRDDVDRDGQPADSALAARPLAESTPAGDPFDCAGADGSGWTRSTGMVGRGSSSSIAGPRPEALARRSAVLRRGISARSGSSTQSNATT